ncbi:MAG: hypothetical protein WBX01_05005 [Nitrososphaeraceae archaeon]
MTSALTGFEPYLSTVIGFVLGFISAVLVRIVTDWYNRPVLAIGGNDAIIIATFPMHSHRERGHVTYYGNRITVENTGRTAAKDCKAYIM